MVNGLFFKYPIDKKAGDHYMYVLFVNFYSVNGKRYGGAKSNNLLASKACNNDIKGIVY